MQKYVFFTKGDKTKILPKNKLDRILLHDLKVMGYKRHHIEVNAENTRQAIEKLHQDNEDNLNSLETFSGDILIYAFFTLLLLFIVCFNL